MKALARCLIALPLLVAGVAAAHAGDLRSLDILGPDYPRAFFFRSSEGMAANPRVSFEQWDGCFSRLMGIMGKVLDEEVPGRMRRNPEFFTRFKRAHRRQVVLMHFNGNARDPRFDSDDFFAGHWVYFNGARVLSDVPAQEGETEIRVSDAGLFLTNTGRYRRDNEDIGLCELDASGRPDWSRSEQVQLVSVDIRGETIRVRRGQYGTAPRAFAAGRAYAAAHAGEGPWGRNSHLMWAYNYSTRCPLDDRGRNAADVLVEDLARRYASGGQLGAFDGLEFDVLSNTRYPARGTRGGDFDADGKADGAVFEGLNTYSLGVIQFLRKLRARLGEETLILADGHGANSQRGFGLLNGIESEGWPTLSDWKMKDWSGGLNRHLYWRQAGRAPVFNYVNHKYTMPGDTPGSRKRPPVPFSTHRLALAAAMLTDSAVCYSTPPPREEGELLGVWDELRQGLDWKVGWLGRPLTPPVRLAERAPDVLHRKALSDLSRWSGKGVRFERSAAELRITARDADTTRFRFRLAGVPCQGPDLYVAATMHGEPLPGMPRDYARMTWIGIAAPAGLLVRSELPPAGMRRRGGEEEPATVDSGSVPRFLRQRRLGGESHNAYLVHPPYRGGPTGYAFWTADVDVPAGGRLDFFTGMGEKSPQRSDGVVFIIQVAGVQDDRVTEFEEVWRHTQKAARWIHHVIDLKPWAGRRVRIKFISDAGPKDNPTTDHAHWGDVAVVGPQGREAWTKPERFMSWTGPVDFTSTAAFREVKSRSVDLEFTIEGAAAVTLSRLSVHCAADAIYREFEHGVVMANPAYHPVTLDLSKLCPGRSFRRLRGSPRQDPETNNGQPVVGPITLGPVDALFLVRTS